MNRKRRKYYCLLITFLSLAQAASSQFSDSVAHYLGYAATGIVNQTATGNSFVLNTGAKFNYKRSNKVFNSGVTWVYGKLNGQQTNNDVTAAADYSIYSSKHPKLYFWGLAVYDKSYSLKVNDRFQGGGGIGYEIFKKGNERIVLSDGFLYEYSDLKTSTIEHDTYQTVRNSFRLKYTLIFGEIIQLDGTHYWQQSLADISDYIIRSNSSLSVKVKKWLRITTALNYNQVNRTHSENLLFTIGFNIDYYF